MFRLDNLYDVIISDFTIVVRKVYSTISVLMRHYITHIL